MELTKTGFIYKLVSKDINVAECYVGSTDNTTVRKSTHKCRCNNVNGKLFNLRVYQYIRANGGFENQEMIVLEVVQYHQKYELKARERHHMELLGATLNSQTPGRTKEEWLQVNVEHIGQYQKQYYENNAEHIKQKHKQYKQENKEQIKQQTTQKHDCQCGGKYTHGHKTHHLKTKKHMAYLEK